MGRFSVWMVVLCASMAAQTPDTTFFEAKIRPVLVSKCYQCHTSTMKSPMGSLGLDTKASTLKGGDGGPVIVPGKPADSRLLNALRYNDADLQMPPTGKLPDAVIADFEKWIASGAPDPRTGASTAAPTPQPLKGMSQADGRKWWAFQPVHEMAEPATKTPKWATTKIDSFILAKLEENKLKPSPAADPAAIVERVYVDLVGYKPSYEEVQAYVNDHSPKAYENLVDRLLASPHYGEQWGRHWMDVARYGEDNNSGEATNTPEMCIRDSFLITGSVIASITWVAIRGLDIGKWLHNVGAVLIMLAYVILIPLPLWAMWRGTLHSYQPIPLELPKLNLFSLAIFGQMTVGALSGFEYVAIMAGECRSAARTIGQSVLFSAPVICLMFILGTSSVLAFIGKGPINVIGPIPQTFRLAFGTSGASSWVAPFAICLLIARAIASSSLIFTGLTRLPMTASWDHLLPAWFSRLDPRHRTPVNSILFVAAVVVSLIGLSMLGVREQEASQLLTNASVVHYALAYIGLFALPLVGALRLQVPGWLKIVAAAGLLASTVSMLIAVYPVVEVVSKQAYATKIISVVLITNAAGVLIYRSGQRRR